MSTLSINVGDQSCNMDCRYCISKTTFKYESNYKIPSIQAIIL